MVNSLPPAGLDCGQPRPTRCCGLLAAGDDVTLTAASGAIAVTGAVLAKQHLCGRGGVTISRTNLLFDALTPVPVVHDGANKCVAGTDRLM